MRDEAGRVTVTAAETDVLRVVLAAGDDGAPLAGQTRPQLGQVQSTAARRLARNGVLSIDAGGTARLTDLGRSLLA